jgi:WD40 repeat protein
MTPDGERIVTAGADHDARLWSVKGGQEIARMSGHGDKVSGLALSPEGNVIATGDAQGEIRLWDIGTGKLERVLAHEHSQIRALVFARAGRMLVSALGYPPYRVIGRDIGSGDAVLTYRGHDNVVSAAALSPDGKWIATAGGQNSEIHVWNSESGVVVRKLGGVGRAVWSVGFARAPLALAWGNVDPCPEERLSCPKEHGVLERQIRLPSGERLGDVLAVDAPTASFIRAVEALDGDMALDHRMPDPKGYESILDIKGRDGVLASIARGPTSGYRHRAYTFTPDAHGVVSGGANGTLTAHDLTGRQIAGFVGHEGDVLAVAVSPDGRYLTSGSGDQTVKLWNAATGELIVSLFEGSDGEWVMWTPQGYYTGSPGADRFVGWQVNRGRDRTPDFVSAAQLRSRLNRPDVVERAIDLASAEDAIRDAPGTTFTLADLIARPVPRFSITATAHELGARPGYGSVRVTLAETLDPVKVIRVYVNGLRAANVIAKKTAGGGFPAGDQTVEVPLAAGRNEVRIVAVNAVGETSDSVLIERKEAGRLDSRGSLYVVAIGVDKYPNAQGRLKDLAYAGSDASAFADAAVRRLGPLHDKATSEILVNAPGSDAPTASRIRAALDMLRQAEDNDTIVIFLAGHGVNDGENYRFMPTDAERAAKGWSTDKTISWHEIEEVLQAAKGRRLLFVDTCRSGNAFNQRLGNSAYHINVIAYASARWDQAALERNDLKHGLFTYAVVEGLDGKVQASAAGQPVTTARLFQFVQSRVASLAKELSRAQEPQYYKGRDAEDYVLVKP